MNRSQRESLPQLLQLANSLPGYKEHAETLLPHLEARRKKVRAILPRADQLSLEEIQNA